MSRVECKLIKKEDWLAVKEIWVDFSSSPYARFDVPKVLDDESVKNRIFSWAENQSKNAFFFGVWYEEKLVGYYSFIFRGEYWEVGYCFLSSSHRKGIAKEGMEKIKRFISLYGKKIVARTALENVPSVRLLLSTGFVKTGEEEVSFYKDDKGYPIKFLGGIFTYEIKD